MQICKIYNEAPHELDLEHVEQRRLAVQEADQAAHRKLVVGVQVLGVAEVQVERHDAARGALLHFDRSRRSAVSAPRVVRQQRTAGAPRPGECCSCC